MINKIQRFEKALARTANHKLIDFWNDLDVDLQNREKYIEELEAVNLGLQRQIQEQSKLVMDSKLLYSAYTNMKMISHINKTLS